MNTEQLRAEFEAWAQTHYYLCELDLEFLDGEYADTEVQGAFEAYQADRAALPSQPSHAGWKEAAIAWEVCASLHREFCKGRDPFFKTRQADFVKHAEDARANALETEALQHSCKETSQDRADAERYRWIRDEAGLMVLPYDDHGLGPEFPCGSDLDKAIDHARSVEGEGK